jgi:uncharacterized protein (DUF2147 family)
MPRLSLFLFAFAATLAVITHAAPADQPQIFGKWLTEDKKGVVDFFGCGDKVCGKLVWIDEPGLLDDQNPNPELRQRPRCGLTILGDFHETAPKHWEDGWIYNPETGKTYHANMAIEDSGMLKLRGFVGIPLFGESQRWTHEDGSHGKC